LSNPKIQFGQVFATPGCLAALEGAGQTVEEFLARHVNGDWGDLSATDAARNNAALVDGSRLLSAYLLRTGIEIWIIAEAVNDEGNRVTTYLLPEEY